MPTVERQSNPTCGDTVILRLFVYNASRAANVQSVNSVSIYFLDPTSRTDENPDGKVLIQTIDGSSVTNDCEGQYSVEVPLTAPSYGVGRYIDVWSLVFNDEDCPASITNNFQVYPDLWLTVPTPIVYDFSFAFRPNRLRHGSKQYITIQVTPNVPKGSDLLRYYENLSIISNLNISMEWICGDCVPKEHDLRMILDCEPVIVREGRFGYYQIDTKQYECGVYQIWFELAQGDSVFVSERMELSIFD